MSLIDTLAFEYKWPPSVIRKLPLAETFCYYEAILQRQGVDTGAPSFTERDILSSLITDH